MQTYGGKRATPWESYKPKQCTNKTLLCFDVKVNQRNWNYRSMNRAKFQTEFIRFTRFSKSKRSWNSNIISMNNHIVCFLLDFWFRICNERIMVVLYIVFPNALNTCDEIPFTAMEFRTCSALLCFFFLCLFSLLCLLTHVVYVFV